MKDILTIIFRLTLSCIVAAVVMGGTFVFTNKAKKHNEHVREERVIYSLLGYSESEPAPETMALSEIYRYIVTDSGSQSIGYLLPGGHGESETFTFVILDLAGKLVSKQAVAIDHEKVREPKDRDDAILASIGAGKQIRYVEQTIVVTENGERVAYLLSGKFTGFKTFISVMLALDPQFSILGLEVMEHEEDPGLGGEIEQDYFKNQFKGKPYDVLKGLKVVKEPLPPEYLSALEGDITKPDVAKIREQYRDNDIYALTGATISTRAVNDGVKGIVKKFAYRVNILDAVLREQEVAVSF